MGSDLIDPAPGSDHLFAADKQGLITSEHFVQQSGLGGEAVAPGGVWCGQVQLGLC